MEMKKRVYVTPAVAAVVLQPVQLLAESGVFSDEMGIGFGGIDTGGEIIPAAPELPDADQLGF